MKKIAEYLRLVLFVGGVLIGVQIPSFVDQYGQRLDAHWRESTLSLEQFQQDANKFFAGDLQRLIQHYLSADDAVVNDGGQSISAIYSRNQELLDARTQFSKTWWSPYAHTALYPLSEIRTQAWKTYDFMVALNSEAIVWGLIAGLFIAVVTELLIVVMRLLFKLFTPRRRRRLQR